MNLSVAHVAALLLGVSLLEACPVCELPCPAQIAPQVLEPAMGATGVRIDTLIWVSDEVADAADAGVFSQSAPVLEVTGPDGAVTGTSNRLTLDTIFGGVTAFRPTSPLAENATYTVMANGGLVTSFTTGSGATGGAPALPVVSVSHQQSAPFTCYFDDNEFTFASPGFLTIAELQGEESAFNPTLPAGKFWDYAGPTRFPDIIIGRGGCNNWNGVATHVRFGTLDTAGQFSGWTGWFALQ